MVCRMKYRLRWRLRLNSHAIKVGRLDRLTSMRRTVVINKEALVMVVRQIVWVHLWTVSWIRRSTNVPTCDFGTHVGYLLKNLSQKSLDIDVRHGITWLSADSVQCDPLSFMKIVL